MFLLPVSRWLAYSQPAINVTNVPALASAMRGGIVLCFWQTVQPVLFGNNVVDDHPKVE